MHNPGLIFAIIAAILIIHFFGFVPLFWLIAVGLLGMVLAFFYMIFRDEGWISSFTKLLKKTWKEYEKFETKLFNWIDGNSKSK